MFLVCLKASQEAYHAAEMSRCVPCSGESRWAAHHQNPVEDHDYHFVVILASACQDSGRVLGDTVQFRSVGSGLRWDWRQECLHVASLWGLAFLTAWRLGAENQAWDQLEAPGPSLTWPQEVQDGGLPVSTVG